MTKIWSIPGGIHPEENKQQSLQLPIGEISLPAELIYPLNQHIGAPATAVVQVGERVLAGQKIAEAKGMISAPIHAGTSGVITAIEERTLPHPSGMSGPCIVLAADGKDEFIAFEPCEDYLSLDRDTLVQKIRNAGIAGMGGAGFPTAVKLSPRANQPIDTLIINGTECEPYITADDILMQTRTDDIVKGTLLLAHLLGNPARVVIGIEDNKPKAIAAVRQAAANTALEVVSFPTKYPSGGEKQLIQILTGREVPSGKLPADIGVVVQNVGTTVAAYEAVRYGKPLIERITTVVGEALQTQRNIRVRLGTPIRHVLAEHGFIAQKGSRLIVGGPMMGYALEQDDVPVVKTTNCILAPTRKELPPPPPAQACIRCGMCAEACPVSLLPQQMYWYAAAEDYDRLEAQNIRDCIECGACSYVCPSNIPLVQYYRAAKGTMRQLALDKEKSDRSRRRFEFRQERMAKAEAEKEAKRLARKQAAEQVNKQKQEAGQSSPAPAAAPNADLVAMALASAKAAQTAQASPEEQRAKLERGVLSAEERLSKLHELHASASASGDKKDRLAAQIKQAELKLQEARDKLANFRPEAAAPAAADANDPVAAAIARAQAKLTMAPDEKLRANLESLQSRLAKAEEKLAVAQAEGSDKVEALQAGVDKLKEKMQAAERELAELPPAPPATAAPADDPVAAAIARAQAKMLMAPDEKLKANLESLQGRLAKAEEKLAAAQAEGSDKVDALQAGVDKLKEKIQAAEQELAELAPAAVAAAPAAPELDAAAAAIERAKAKAEALATMSEEDKLRDQLTSLEARLEKARQRLAKAQAEDDPNIDAFNTGVEKIETKLQQTREQLAGSGS